MKFKDWVIPGARFRQPRSISRAPTCRRAERPRGRTCERRQELQYRDLRYLNRLSDLCWLLARKIEARIRRFWIALF
jgi:cob(I)alamin adenosyltransferase